MPIEKFLDDRAGIGRHDDETPLADILARNIYQRLNQPAEPRR